MHHIESEESTTEVDRAEDNLGDEGVLDSDRLEDGGTVVEEVIGTRELLERLQ